ncbi:hypothetical protein P3W45_000216 [Vairimorpha bombi]|jgi:hypothetical protein
MNIPFECSTAVFIFINLFSVVTYAILGEKISDIEEEDKKASIFTPNVVSIVYLELIIFIGVRIFAFFIGNNLNDYFLHRMLNPGGLRTKLRVLAILIGAELCIFGTYMFYLLYPFQVLHDEDYYTLLVLICLTYIFNFINLIFIYNLHPDLFGINFKRSVDEYCDRINERNEILLNTTG